MRVTGKGIVRQDFPKTEKSARVTSLPVATILDKAGLSATEIADYLGHENPSMTRDVYMNTLKGSSRAAEVLNSV